MLITAKDEKNNTIEMINVSSLKGKENKLIYDSNMVIKNYNPLPVPSFAKLKTIYKLENTEKVEDHIAFSGKKLSEEELLSIKNERQKYINKHKDANTIKFETNDFISKNAVQMK